MQPSVHGLGTRPIFSFPPRWATARAGWRVSCDPRSAGPLRLHVLAQSCGAAAVHRQRPWRRFAASWLGGRPGQLGQSAMGGIPGDSCRRRGPRSRRGSEDGASRVPNRAAHVCTAVPQRRQDRAERASTAIGVRTKHDEGRDSSRLLASPLRGWEAQGSHVKASGKRGYRHPGDPSNIPYALHHGSSRVASSSLLGTYPKRPPAPSRSTEIPTASPSLSPCSAYPLPGLAVIAEAGACHGLNAIFLSLYTTPRAVFSVAGVVASGWYLGRAWKGAREQGYLGEGESTQSEERWLRQRTANHHSEVEPPSWTCWAGRDEFVSSRSPRARGPYLVRRAIANRSSPPFLGQPGEQNKSETACALDRGCFHIINPPHGIGGLPPLIPVDVSRYGAPKKHQGRHP